MTAITEVVDALTLRTRVTELGDQIARDYEGREPLVLGVLKGAVPFVADLVRRLPPSIDIDFLGLTRFGDRGRVAIAVDSGTSLVGRDVIVVEDIVDTGLTLSYLLGLLETREPASLATVTLVDKVQRRIVDVPLEYRGFEVGDEFLVGYGLDWNGRFRNLGSLWAVLDLAALREDPLGWAAEAFRDAGDRLPT
ncbi:MAG TPA: hypoxanthine phosphoribosyltransferase [Acidimicrobiia bacterium]|nr:hypoxanthine phosphoribosyltransferase [Acidimicrobiia bacterium]